MIAAGTVPSCGDGGPVRNKRVKVRRMFATNRPLFVDLTAKRFIENNIQNRTIMKKPRATLMIRKW